MNLTIKVLYISIAFLLYSCEQGETQETPGDAGTEAAGTSSAGTSSAGTPSAGTESAGTESAGTESAGTESAGTETAGTETAGTETAGTETAGTETAGTETAGTETAGTESAGTETAGTETAGTETAGTETAGTETAGTETAGTETAGTETAGTEATLPEPNVHRAEHSSCSPNRVVNEVTSFSDEDQCSSHDECEEGLNGRCEQQNFRFPVLQCNYDQCMGDDECGDTVCECDESIANFCFSQGNCKVDADCGAEGWCSPTLGSCGDYGGTVGYFCRTPEDECLNDEECPNNGYCAYQSDVGHWECRDIHCVGK